MHITQAKALNLGTPVLVRASAKRTYNELLSRAYYTRELFYRDQPCIYIGWRTVNDGRFAQGYDSIGPYNEGYIPDKHYPLVLVVNSPQRNPFLVFPEDILGTTVEE